MDIHETQYQLFHFVTKTENKYFTERALLNYNFQTVI